MNALVLHAVGDLRLQELPRPEPRPGQVLVRVCACGVCGSDLPRIFVKGTYRFPTVCGHEFAGTVERCGEGVTDLQAGEAVTVFPLIWCGRCAACERGQYAQCADYDYLGSRSDGAFAEYVVAPRRNVLPLPAGLSLDEAALTEPAAVALHAIRRGRCHPGETVAIFGAGPVGLLAAQWARAMGAARVALFDLVADKLRLARQLGFDLVFNPQEKDALATIKDLTAGRGAELSVEAAGVPATMRNALAAAGANGRVVLLGNPSADVTLPAALISQTMRRELAIYGTWNSDYSASGNADDWRAVLQAAASKSVQLMPLITHRFGLADAVKGLVMMRDQKEFFCKVLIQP
jgi:L-iditol 2-dehydrogenase